MKKRERRKCGFSLSEKGQAHGGGATTYPSLFFLPVRRRLEQDLGRNPLEPEALSECYNSNRQAKNEMESRISISLRLVNAKTALLPARQAPWCLSQDQGGSL